MVDRTHRELTDDDIATIASTYHAWRGEPDAGEYNDVAGLCASATIEQITEHRFVLTPGRYVGTEDAEDDGEPITERIARLKRDLYEAIAESDRLQAQVREALERIDGCMEEIEHPGVTRLRRDACRGW
jgi:type I restriction enzyme M protein